MYYRSNCIKYDSNIPRLRFSEQSTRHIHSISCQPEGSKGERQMSETANEALNEGKKKRRNAKSSFTRAVNGLKYLLENERPETEIEESLVNLEKSYNDLEAKHENFMVLIEDDEEYDSQEAWMDECQQRVL